MGSQPVTTANAGPGEIRLRQAIRRVHRPEWLSDRLTALQLQMRALRKNYSALQLQEIMHGLDVPMELINALEQCRVEIKRVEEELDVLTAGWDVITQQREGG